jgi:hypothetical protein
VEEQVSGARFQVPGAACQVPGVGCQASEKQKAVGNLGGWTSSNPPAAETRRLTPEIFSPPTRRSLKPGT